MLNIQVPAVESNQEKAVHGILDANIGPLGARWRQSLEKDGLANAYRLGGQRNSNTA
jgi:hypothetical protein